MKRIFSGLLILTLVGALFSAPARAAGDQAETRPDTQLGNYDEAPYRDVATFAKDGLQRRIVELPAEHVFDPELLDRTVVIGGRKWRDLVIVARMWDQRVEGHEGGMRFYVYDLFERQDLNVQSFLDTVNANWSPQVPQAEREQMLQNAYEGTLRVDVRQRVSGAWEWPMREEIVSINGRPWQETEWREFIIAETKKLKPGDPVLAKPGYWDAYLNPDYNGRARELLTEPAGVKPAENPPQGTVVPTVDQVILTLGSNQVTRYHNGAVEMVTLDAPVEAVNGVTMVPLRGILDHFGASLTYTDNTITIVDGSTGVTLRVGEATAVVGEAAVPLLAPAEIRNGRTMVPLRFVGEALGYHVTWDPATNQIAIRR